MKLCRWTSQTFCCSSYCMHTTYLYDAKYFLFIMEGSVRKVGFKKRFFLVFFRIDHTHTCVGWNMECAQKLSKLPHPWCRSPSFFSRQNSIIINTSFGIKIMEHQITIMYQILHDLPGQLMTGANGRPFISFTKTWISVGILMVGVVIVDSSFSFFLLFVIRS